MKKLTLLFLCVLMLAVLSGSLTGVLPFAAPARPVQCCRAEAAPSDAETLDVIRVVVTGDNVNIRSAPSSKGKVYRQADSGDAFLVDPAPIRDSGDNSEWYKILFDVGRIEHEWYGYHFLQAQKMSVHDFSHPYISARFVRKEPLGEFDKNYLDSFKRGRPAWAHVGDDLSIYCADVESNVLKTSVDLYKEPVSGSEKFETPAGTAVFFGIDPEGRRLHHTDMDDVNWFCVMDENNKLIGWAYDEEIDHITK